VSERRDELLELAYRHALSRGTTDLSLRPLAAAIGSSPRVLLFLFGSRDALVRELLARARGDELALLGEADGADLAEVALAVWTWLADPRHRALLVLWAEAYARSLTDPEGPWGGFAQATVEDWLGVLAAAQSPRERRTRAGLSRRTAVLAVLRGALLDLLATGDHRRTTDGVRRAIEALR
jgi:AcrR family transcriptional regulator